LIHIFLNPVVKPITEAYLISNYHQEKTILRVAIPATFKKRNDNYQCQKK